MKKALFIAALIYFTGFILKFFHLPLTAWMMISGLLLMIIILMYALFAKKADGIFVGIGLTSATWLTALLFTLKFWPFVPVLIILASLLTVLFGILAVRKGKVRSLIPLAGSVAITSIFYLMPADTRYYLISIKWNHEIESDYFSWDKYSWFLYQNGKYDEAIQASEKALGCAKDAEETMWIELIEEHHAAIVNRDWNHFH